MTRVDKKTEQLNLIPCEGRRRDQVVAGQTFGLIPTPINQVTGNLKSTSPVTALIRTYAESNTAGARRGFCVQVVPGVCRGRITLLLTSPNVYCPGTRFPLRILVNMRTFMHSLFKPIVAVLCLVFALCFASTHAHADSIIDGTINFTVLSGGPTPIGSFIFDITANEFTSFTVDWNGEVFSFAMVFNSLGLAVAGQASSWCAAAPVNFTYSCAPVAATFQF